MKFAIATKHLHLVVQYREPDEDEDEGRVINTGGQFETVDAQTGDAPGDDPDMHFGYLRG